MAELRVKKITVGVVAVILTAGIAYIIGVQAGGLVGKDRTEQFKAQRELRT